MADAAHSSSPRERGWRRLLPALTVFLLVPAVPLLRVIAPVEQTLLLVVSALAACALAGWWLGGRAWLAVLTCAAAGWLLVQPTGSASLGYDRFARGWSMVLAGAFGLATLLDPRRALFTRAMSGLGIAALVAAVALWGGRVPTGHLVDEMRGELAARHAPFLDQWRQIRASPVMRDMEARDAEAGAELDAWTDSYDRLPTAVASGFPALLALESLAALALAWSIYHRVSRTRIGPPLAPLSQFRFNDQMVWGFIAGLVIAAVPALSALRGLGVNLLLFFGALYALRGLGVLSWLLKPGWFTTLAFAVSAPLLFPLYAAGALAFGVGDTWIDWRRRPARPTS